MHDLLTLTAIRAAANRLKGQHVYTPLLESPSLNRQLNARILFKAECLQRTGSFKFRGAYNKISQLSDAEKSQGLVAYSSGNHAQGVAESARLLGIDATIIMPEDAPSLKINNTRNLGAKVILYDRWHESREAIGTRIAEQTQAQLIKPYDDMDIIQGQATVGLEMAEQAQALDAAFDHILIPCGGGGLTAGCSSAIHALSEYTRVWSVEPQYFDDTARSLQQGRRLSNNTEQRSICDAIVTPSPGELTFPIMQRYVKGGLVVTDQHVIQAMKVAAEALKLMVEPGGVVGLAAILSGKIDITGQTLGVVLSGGNIDHTQFCTHLNRF